MLDLEIKPLRKNDYSKAIHFAVIGMKFDRYADSQFIQGLYGRYFWYEELIKSSQVIAAYYGDELAGVLLADIKNEQKISSSLWIRLYVRVFNFIVYTFFKESAQPYDDINRQMLDDFLEDYDVDGEICFLAANPGLKIRGIGTLLLKELEKREIGKRIYLYTDDNCTYQFYEHRGFKRVGEGDIILKFGLNNKVPLSCYLYSKICGE